MDDGRGEGVVVDVEEQGTSPRPRYGEVVNCPAKRFPCGGTGVVERRLMLRPFGFVPYFYCGRHGNWVFVEGRWWFFSFFRPGVLVEEDALATCPRRCWGSEFLNDLKMVFKGKDGRFHCSHCRWSADAIPGAG
ncbi:MAG: hypothetical protein KGJ23_08825 [Euryarchaeota archaeon]|nr:hypothetical protein [Euryarchaeota archaeon]MDE1836707.1 hypothetical protein [Euryarchaeota archaeon]MDE1880264.1 hypothetical protein [Euryarchaeota archaeon]MDE2044677.1 hypothetical protein [Thermoplasmata archaeon]